MASISVEEIELKWNASIYTAIVRRKATSEEALQSSLRYRWAFEEVWAVGFLNVHLADIVEDMVFSNFLNASYSAINVLYSLCGHKVV